MGKVLAGSRHKSQILGKSQEKVLDSAAHRGDTNDLTLRCPPKGTAYTPIAAARLGKPLHVVWPSVVLAICRLRRQVIADVRAPAVPSLYPRMFRSGSCHSGTGCAWGRSSAE